MQDITRLWFDGDHGLARINGISVDLVALPLIVGMPAHLRAIDFVPAMRVAMVRESGQAWREMAATERAFASEWLANLCDAVRNATNPPARTA